MSNTFVYLTLGLSLLIPVLVILALRRDLLPKALKIGAIGGLAGLISEFFYFRDYWHPPSLFGQTVLSLEDVLFGATITILAFAIYPFVFRKEITPLEHPSHRKLYGIFFAIGLVTMLVVNLLLGINSIFVTSFLFIVLLGVILWQRPDLAKLAAFSTGIVMAYIIAVYCILFNVLSPDYWNSYWLLADTAWGVTILGNIPLTELIWYAGWIAFASVSYPYVSGKNFAKQP